MNIKLVPKKNKEHLSNFIKLIVFFLILEAYMIFKFCYSNSNINNIKKFIKVFNITQFSHASTILSIDIMKSYFYNSSIPILNKKIDEENFFNPFNYSFYNITKEVENMLISTSQTNSFLKGNYKEIMDKSIENFLNNSKIVQISLFIVVIVIVALAYCIIWKSYEEQLTLLLKRSFDLINLIPEEIKYLIVSKLNE